jgi:hypothetical protein
MRFYGRLTYAQIAEEHGWYSPNGEPAKNYAFEYVRRGLALLADEMEIEGIDKDEIIRHTRS